MKLRFTTVLLVVASAFLLAEAVDFVGDWIEDDTRRENLSDFLSAVELGFFKRSIALGRTWQGAESITWEKNRFAFSIEVGPFHESHHFSLFPDNTTVSEVNYGDLGQYETTSAIVDNSLMAYSVYFEDQALEILVNRTIVPTDPNIMIVTITHWPSRVSVVSYLNRKL